MGIEPDAWLSWYASLSVGGQWLVWFVSAATAIAFLVVVVDGGRGR